METKINYKIRNANLTKINDEPISWELNIETEKPVKIYLSETNQEDLKDVFNELIREMIEEPYELKFHPLDISEAKSMNEVCEKYIDILNNDLKGVFDEYTKEHDKLIKFENESETNL